MSAPRHCSRRARRRSLAARWLTLVALLLAGAAYATPAPDHTPWSALLSRHVRDGAVDYAGLQRERATLDAYVRDLGRLDAATRTALPRAAQLAYWINAYNAFVVQTVVDHYPIRGRTLRGIARPSNSIWQIPDAFDGRRFTVAGRRVSLDEIEHEIIRPTFREPRVHFALVCAARGCPKLRSEAYVPDRLDAQLEEQTRRYLADARNGLVVDERRGTVRVSRIFDWFAADFASKNRAVANAGIREFIARHADDPALADRLRTGALRIEYLDYDWTLNER